MQNEKFGTFFVSHTREVKVRTLKLLLDILSHFVTKMPQLAPFEGRKGHGAPSDADPLGHFLFHIQGR